MVEFNTDYWHGMEEKPLEKIDLSPKEIGISMGIGDPWVKLKSAITAGASHVELGFMGVGRGSIADPMSVTPDTIGRDKREDIRQMAKVNDVTLSTHASANIIGFAGFEKNRFNEQKATDAVHEVKRAIDFAADTAGGGPVVIHTGEFPRPICETGKEFEAFKDEEKKSWWGVVDGTTGEIKQVYSRDLKLPVVKRDPKTNDPIVDKEGRYKYEYWDYNKFVEMSKEKNMPPEKLLEFHLREQQKLTAEAEERKWFSEAERARESLKAVKNMQDSVEELKKKDRESAEYTAMKYVEKLGMSPSKEMTDEYRKFLKDPIEFLNTAVEKVKHNVKYAEDASVASGMKRKELEESAKNLMTLKEFGVEKSARNIAELGMYAIEVGKAKKLKKPIFIAPENVFPEQYGSHPQELKEIILKAREEMANMLVQKKRMSQEEAKKTAEKHIKATFDVGHANIWKKYFKGTEEEYKKWFKKEIKDLIKHKVIGHVHLADNFGYSDEHLTPGQGNAPIEDFIKELRKAGIKEKMVVEPGAQGEGESIHSSMIGAWAKVAGSPMYRVGGVSKSWTDIEGSYFGRTFSPSYMAGSYLINPQGEENWWSGVPIE